MNRRRDLKHSWFEIFGPSGAGHENIASPRIYAELCNAC
jgi:hypothetical protein